MKTDTAHVYWGTEWAKADGTTKWERPEAEVMDFAQSLPAGAAVLDLGAGVGRHALALARQGFAVSALDAAPEGIAEITRVAAAEGLTVDARIGMMTDLPFKDGSFDHVLSWNVIYHGDEVVLRETIAEIARVLKPGGTFLGTMLSARRVPVQLAKTPGREISRNTWVFEGAEDKVHPHYFCNGRDLLELFSAFEICRLEDREHETPGSWHWHLVLERL
ncbi:class I SAM-dependent methyltransferase [Tabrizicola piscis]|uniref:Class I SAM-dependent methyltransferase n=1 Tax=Tabrizicola piscis TaxID=2494374 RepID=A0A3S8U3Y6_9RHOB|nr:class I SAM-dependent methyltransferase [Tabrizicola piscis]AZL58280.1 class I SAM-dependent methyltransferase [Tabrizicola piscis]